MNEYKREVSKLSKKYWIMGLFLCVVVGFVGYQILGSTGIQQISTLELEERLAAEGSSQGVLYLDVREEHEFREGHIAEMINMPLSSLPETYAQLPKDQEIVIICRSGKRSMEAVQLLQEQGYTKLVNVKGGMLDWKGAIVME